MSAPDRPDSWLTTGDHKRIGRLFILAGLAAVATAAIVGAGVHLDAGGHRSDLLTRPGSRLGAIALVAGLVVGVPALWVGLATVVVPLQLGATRLALPRLHALSLWSFLGGDVLFTVGVLADRPNAVSLGASGPPFAATGAAASNSTEICLAGLGLIALATMLAAASLLVTILTKRAEGVRLLNMPLFAWSVLSTAIVLLLATPVFFAGLVLLYYDQHSGGQLFAGGGSGALRVWQHQLWLLGRPEALLFAASGVGLGCDIVATTAGRPLLAFAVARAAAITAPFLTLLVWAARVSGLTSPFAPVATPIVLAVGAPLAVALLIWLATLRVGRLRVTPGLFGVVGLLLAVGVATTASVAGLLTDVDPSGAASFRSAQTVVLSLAAPLLVVAAGLAHWSTKLGGRLTSSALAGLQVLAILGGGVLLGAPGYVAGLGGAPPLVVGTVGGLAIAGGVVLLAGSVVGRAASPAPADPYGGLTLEWAAPSPPPPANFDELPDVASPHPLHDSRLLATAGEKS